VDVHDLTAAYALHALDDVERERYEAHLAQCEGCREELARLTESAAALAWAVESPAPPGHLRERILEAASAGRENVVPLVARPRAWQGAAAVAACAAIGLGIWAATLSNALHDERTHASALSIVADPSVQKAELSGGNGMVAVTRDGRGVLVVDKLPAAPSGKTYEAWVIPPGGKPQAAGTFDGGDGMTMVVLDAPVAKGAVVAATVEPDGGLDQPSSKPLLTAQT
jgi:anti-sigma-K factor RskA